MLDFLAISSQGYSQKEISEVLRVRRIL